MSDHRTEIVTNAARLLGDAKLLSDNGRFASAFALAVLGLEEVGKVVLDIWSHIEPLPKLSHLQKQMAVGSLLLAEFAVSTYGHVDTTMTLTDTFVEEVARAFYGSAQGRFLSHIAIEALEKTKQVGIYRDDWLSALSLHASQFKEADVVSICDAARNAVAALSNNRIVQTGRAIFQITSLEFPRSPTGFGSKQLP